MIKKITSLIGIVLLGFSSFGQTIVSTSPENKKVILEEFTGIHCVYCPEGHVIAQAIKDANPNDAFLINIHVGSFANPGSGEPDFRTPYGTAIVNQTGLIGYPAATVNRRNFPGFEQGNSGTTAMSRNRWTTAANQTLALGSNVNVAVEATIDVSTNTLIVHAEGYYTANGLQSTNLLNIALLQNNTLGPQTGGNSGNEYNHQHRLVEMITGQWGIEIPVTTTGTFVDETFSYPIPADYNGVPVELAELEVVAFITETHQEIPSGSGAKPTYSGFIYANDAYARYVEDIDTQCGFEIAPSVNVQNVGNDEITSLTIEYSINSGPTETYNWSGSILSLENVSIELPLISYNLDTVNTVNVSIQDDENNSNNVITGSFDPATVTTSNLHLIFNTVNQGANLTWDITDPSGTVLYNGGPYSNNQTILDDFVLPGECYKFAVHNSAGNGSGSIVLHDDGNTVAFQSTGNFEGEDNGSFSTSILAGVDDNKLSNTSIYPNPTNSQLFIANAENSSVEVYNMLGQVLYAKNNISMNEQISVSHLSEGTYFVKITNGNAVKTSKFIVAK